MSAPLSLGPLAPMDRGPRLERVRRALVEEHLDALVVSKLVNVHWLTGFTGSAGVLLVLADHLVFITDGRYQDQISNELAVARVDAQVVIARDPAATLSSVATGRHLERVGLEADDISWAQSRRADADWFPQAEMVPTSGTIEGLRAVKEPEEIARISAAAQIADAALAEVIGAFEPGVTESDVAFALDSAMRRAGSEEAAFDTIVASGPNSALPHHHPGERRIERGDLLVIDMGATVEGYRSDMTRSFTVGEPSDVQVRLLEVVGRAQAAGLSAVSEGAACRDVDAAARTVISGAGWADEFVHPTGHGLGLEIHEPLRLAATADATLAAGHVVTVEPGVYLPGVGGVRIEDTVEVTAEGCRPLTRSSLPTVIG